MFIFFHGTNTEWIEGENNFVLINNFSSKMLMSHGPQASKCKGFFQNFNLAKLSVKVTLISVELHQGSLAAVF